MSSQQREDIWKSMLEAEANDCAWSDEAKRYGSFARQLSIWTSILSSGTLLALITVPKWHSIAGTVLAAISAIVSIIHTAQYSPVRLKQIATLAGEWKALAIDYRLLWSEVHGEETPSAQQWNKYQSLCREEKKIDESGFRLSTEKMRAAQNTIKRRRGLA